MGAWSPDRTVTNGKPSSYGRFRFEREKVSKWNCVFRESVAAGEMLRSGDYRYSIWVAVGTREQVRESLVMMRAHAAWLP